MHANCGVQLAAVAALVTAERLKRVDCRRIALQIEQHWYLHMKLSFGLFSMAEHYAWCSGFSLSGSRSTNDLVLVVSKAYLLGAPIYYAMSQWLHG